MKRWILYVCVIALCSATALREQDIAKLIPVEAVWLTKVSGQVYLQTDTGDRGRGDDLAEALRDMKASATGTIFLETADYLIVEKGQEGLLEQASGVFRRSCMVCTAKQIPDMEAVAKYLSAHEPAMTLHQWKIAGKELQMLTQREGRLELVAK